MKQSIKTLNLWKIFIKSSCETIVEFDGMSSESLLLTMENIELYLCNGANTFWSLRC